jgi:hypothetical protein
MTSTAPSLRSWLRLAVAHVLFRKGYFPAACKGFARFVREYECEFIHAVRTVVEDLICRYLWIFP